MMLNESPQCAAAADPAGAWIDLLHYSCSDFMEQVPFLDCEAVGIPSTLTRFQSHILQFLNGGSVFGRPSTYSSPPVSLYPPKFNSLSQAPVMHPNLVCTLKSILSPGVTEVVSPSSTSGDGSRCTQFDLPDMAEVLQGSVFRGDCSAKASSPESTSWSGDTYSKQALLQAEAVMVPLDVIRNRRPYRCAFTGCQRTFKNPQTMRMHHKTHFTDSASTSSKLGPAVETAAALVSSSSYATMRAGQNKKTPSRCPTCYKTFVGLYELRRHFGRKHSEGERRHACRKCGKRFHIKVDLRDHEKLCGESIVCSGCGMKFAFKCNLVAHKRNRHPECQADAEENLGRSSQFNNH